MSTLSVRQRLAFWLFAALAPIASAALFASDLIHKVEDSERLELTVNTSRTLTTEYKIPRLQVGDPKVLSAAPLGPNKVQVYGRTVGVSQVNLWDEQGVPHTIDILVVPDAKMLESQLKLQFPDASLQVTPVGQTAILKGYVDRADQIQRIISVAQAYYPNPINNISVGGAQQVLLHVKVCEVSRTKLRDFGFDFADISNAQQNAVVSGVSGLLSGLNTTTQTPTSGIGNVFVRNQGISATGVQTFSFGIVDPGNSFFGLLTALEQNQLAKVLAQPTLVTVSGRPAMFSSGGTAPIVIPNSLGTPLINYRDFGTTLDFVPIVLGNGKIRLEVRPVVEELDASLSVPVNGGSVPGFRRRMVDTGVELQVGQTLALAGLIQSRVDRRHRGIPWLGDLPVIGAAFRREIETVNEVELLIMVRPELAEAMDECEAPPLGPGEFTRRPTDGEFYWRAIMEQPTVPGIGPDGVPYGPGVSGASDADCLPEGPGMIQEPGGRPIPAEPIDRPQPTSATDGSGARRSPSSIARKTAARSEEVARTNAPSSRQSRNNPRNRVNSDQRNSPGLIGPSGYDVKN